MRRWSLLPLLVTAWTGVVLGHLLAYAAVHPDPVARHRHLLATGHGSFDVLVHSLALALPAALLLTALRAVLRPGPIGTAGGARRLLAGLASVQVPLFVLLECLERGFSPAAALSDPAVLLGVVAQLLVAVGSTALLVGLGRTVARAVAASTKPRRPEPAQAPLPPEREWAARLTFLAGAPRRAPPAAVGA